jgi:cobalt/nickel transport system permease protein
MEPNFLDRYSRAASCIHRRPAWLKLVVALALILWLVITPREGWAVFWSMSVVLVLVTGLSRIPASFLLRRLGTLEPVVIGVAALSLWQPNGGPVFVGLVIKSTLSLWTMILLANTTPFAELLQVLRRLRCPAILVTTLALLYRYLFVLLDESRRMQRARQCRTLTTQRQHRWRALATVAGQLFVRSTGRAERIYAAMCARGWK